MLLFSSWSRKSSANVPRMCRIQIISHVRSESSQQTSKCSMHKSDVPSVQTDLSAIVCIYDHFFLKTLFFTCPWPFWSVFMPLGCFWCSILVIQLTLAKKHTIYQTYCVYCAYIDIFTSIQCLPLESACILGMQPDNVYVPVHSFTYLSFVFLMKVAPKRTQLNKSQFKKWWIKWLNMSKRSGINTITAYETKLQHLFMYHYFLILLPGELWMMLILLLLLLLLSLLLLLVIVLVVVVVVLGGVVTNLKKIIQ